MVEVYRPDLRANTKDRLKQVDLDGAITELYRQFDSNGAEYCSRIDKLQEIKADVKAQLQSVLQQLLEIREKVIEVDRQEAAVRGTSLFTGGLQNVLESLTLNAEKLQAAFKSHIDHWREEIKSMNADYDRRHIKLEEFFAQDDKGWDSKKAFEIARQQVAATISFAYQVRKLELSCWTSKEVDFWWTYPSKDWGDLLLCGISTSVASSTANLFTAIQLHFQSKDGTRQHDTPVILAKNAQVKGMQRVDIDKSKAVKAVRISGRGELRVNRIQFVMADESVVKVEIDQRYDFLETSIDEGEKIVGMYGAMQTHFGLVSLGFIVAKPTNQTI